MLGTVVAVGLPTPMATAVGAPGPEWRDEPLGHHVPLPNADEDARVGEGWSEMGACDLDSWVATDALEATRGEAWAGRDHQHLNRAGAAELAMLPDRALPAKRPETCSTTVYRV